MHPRRFLRRRRNLWLSSQSKKTKRKDRKRKKNERTAIALGSDDDEVFLGASGQFQFALVAVRDAVGAADFVAGQLRQHCGVVFVLFCFFKLILLIDDRSERARHDLPGNSPEGRRTGPVRRRRVRRWRRNRTASCRIHLTESEKKQHRFGQLASLFVCVCVCVKPSSVFEDRYLHDSYRQ